MSRPVALAALALLAAAALYMAIDAGLRPAVLAAASFALALALVAGVFLLWNRAGMLLQKLFPPAPLWEKPRPFSTLFDKELAAPLLSRLDLVEREGRAALWQDRHTGQFWGSFAEDFEFGENDVHEPVDSPENWRETARQAGLPPL